MTSLAIKRIYEHTRTQRRYPYSGRSALAEGYYRDKVRIDLWLRDISPSALRKRFHGKPDDWAQFRRAHYAELKHAPAQLAVKTLLDKLRSGPVTLLYM